MQRIERASCAQIVVVLAARSDEYREVPWAIGAVAAWTSLAMMVWSPFAFSDLWLPVDALLVGGLMGWWARGAVGLARSFVPARIRAARVRAAAEAAFVQEAVHGTRGRVGVLVYASRLEGEVVVLPDQGILGKVPGAELATLRIDGRTDQGLLAGLDALGVILGRHAPPDGHEENEIADAPRVRP